MKQYIYAIATVRDEEGDSPEDLDGYLTFSMKGANFEDFYDAFYTEQEEEMAQALIDIDLYFDDEVNLPIPRGKLQEVRTQLSSLGFIEYDPNFQRHLYDETEEEDHYACYEFYYNNPEEIVEMA
jgi:hypothetical protein